MLNLHKVASVIDVPPGQSKVVQIDGQPIAVFNVNGAFFAIHNRCPHAAGPLDQGWVDDGCIVCPWHGWTFQLSPENAPNDGILRYPVVIKNGDLYIDSTEL